GLALVLVALARRVLQAGEARVEAAPRDAEEARGGGLVAARLGDRVVDELALEAVEREPGCAQIVEDGGDAAAGGRRPGSGGEERRAVEEEGPRQRVLQLADVPGKRVALERLQRRRRQPIGAEAALRQDVERDGADVLRALAERRDEDRKHVEAVVEVLAEPA